MDVQKAVETLMEWMQVEGTTQDELARKAGYSPSLVSRIFKFQRNPSVEVIGRLAEALGHSREEILRIADYLPYEKERDARISRIIFLIENLPGPAREDVEEFVHYLSEKEKRKRRNNKSDK